MQMKYYLLTYGCVCVCVFFYLEFQTHLGVKHPNVEMLISLFSKILNTDIVLEGPQEDQELFQKAKKP